MYIYIYLYVHKHKTNSKKHNHKNKETTEPKWNIKTLAISKHRNPLTCAKLSVRWSHESLSSVFHCQLRWDSFTSEVLDRWNIWPKLNYRTKGLHERPISSFDVVANYTPQRPSCTKQFRELLASLKRLAGSSGSKWALLLHAENISSILKRPKELEALTGRNLWVFAI